MNSEGMFDLMTIIKIILRKLWIIILVAAVFTGGTAYVTARFYKKVYQAKVSLYVLTKYYYNDELQPTTYDDIMVSQQMVKDYSELIKSNRVTSAVIEELGITDITPEQLAGMLSISLKQDTNILEIIVTDTIPLRAKDIANTVSEVFIEKIRALTHQDNISIVDEAKLPVNPVNSKRNVSIILALLVSVVGTAGLIILLEYVNNKVRTVDDIENKLGYSVLGIIPKMNIK